MQLSKTNFLQYLNCPKSLWLLKNKPELYPKRLFSNYGDKLAKEGYKVQTLVQSFLLQEQGDRRYLFEEEYKTRDGLFASADIISPNEDGTLNLYEVKSSSSISDGHLIDATFQTIIIEKTKRKVKSVYIVHLNKEYIRGATLDLGKMVTFTIVTEQVRGLENDLKVKINSALKLLAKPEIDVSSCSCLYLSRSHHCESFNYFNPNIPKASIYNLPRIQKKKLIMFSSERRFCLNDINEDELSGNQLKVLLAAKSNAPVINKNIIEKFYNQVRYPIYFLDYETYSSAIPFVEGVKPHAHIPFQYSVHIKQEEDALELQHFEYIAEKAELPLKMIQCMEKIIGPKGSVVSWHKSFENTRNKEMAIIYPSKAKFLNSISERTIDLEDIFKGGYVDIEFGGSTSIKKVLPAIIPDLSYDNMEVANGTDAMEAFTRMLNISSVIEKGKLRDKMLNYCKLDTMAMVKIFEKMKEYI